MVRSQELYEFLLNGILHLFAILSARRGGSHEEMRRLVEAYLRGNLGIQSPEEYIGLFDELLDFCEMEDETQLEARLVHLCRQLDTQLSLEQKHTLFLRLFELSRGVNEEDSRLNDLVRRTMDLLGVGGDELEDLKALVLSSDRPETLSERFVLLTSRLPAAALRCKVMVRDHFRAECAFLMPAGTRRVLMVARQGEVTLDGALVPGETVCVIEPGSILRDVNSHTVYFFEIDQALRSDTGKTPAVCFEAHGLNYTFPGSASGLHNFHFRETSGRLIGVMGGSGVGKSTLVNILNGTLPPDRGSVTINGVDLYSGGEQLRGVIGYVPQDDLLFEDLTVYQNLYFNARLCLSHLDDREIHRRIESVLRELNQLEIAHLKVGGPLDKTISGGQRKRLNIALELMREPAILFLDEPTSGLSSADSENVMGLLKAQAQRDRLVIAIIHQPSSSIFRMLDSLWVLDRGGYPIYAGHPLEAAPHFRDAAHIAGVDRSACPECGSVHPEQIFGIVEARAIDEDGRLTRERKHPPRFWHDVYLRRQSSPPVQDVPERSLPATPPPCRLDRPSLLRQVQTFFHRNVTSRLANRSYLAVTLLEPPLLAWITATLCRASVQNEYTYGDNPYVGVFFFMSTIMALFLGLSVSAEEIVRDRRVLKRESFLHLSWPAYSMAKMLYLACVSAIQTAFLASVSIMVLEIPDFFLKLWAVLFSCALLGAALGLNLSASLKTAATVYILIPLLLIPQMLLGGLIIKYDDLRASDAGHNLVPFVGNLMTTRWGFEALVVGQFQSNRYQRHYDDVEGQLSRAGYVAQELIPEIISRMDSLALKTDLADKLAKDERTRRLVAHEIERLERMDGSPPGFSTKVSSLGLENTAREDEVKAWLQGLTRRCEDEHRRAQEARRAINDGLLKEYGAEGLVRLRKRYHNESLVRLVRNKGDLDRIRISGERFVQVSDPVYQLPASPWGSAPFMAGRKRVGTLVLDTYAFNVLFIWATILVLSLALQLRLLPRLIEAGWWRGFRSSVEALGPKASMRGMIDRRS